MFFSYKDIFREGEKVAMRHSVWVPNKLEPHTHDFFEIAYILRGNGYHYLNGNKHKINTGDLFLLTPNGQHNFVPDEARVLEWINCMFVPDVIDPHLIGITNTADLLNALIFLDSFQYDTSDLTGIELLSSIEDLNRIFKDMSKEYEWAKIGYQEALKNYLQILLIKIFRAYYIKDQKSGENIRTAITDLVMTHLQSISFSQNIQIDELARQAFYSPQHFRKLFKEESGVSLSSFIREQRLDNACDILVETDLSVMQVMEQVGFNDTKSFYSAFLKFKGMTPAQYRARHQNIKTNNK